MTNVKLKSCVSFFFGNNVLIYYEKYCTLFRRNILWVDMIYSMLELRSVGTFCAKGAL